MKNNKAPDVKAEKIQDELEKSERPEKYESRYKHGGPGRTVKKRKAD
jgi:hypothetical protein